MGALDMSIRLEVKDLLARGYLPTELPPPFSSASFATSMIENGTSLPKEFTNSNKSFSKMAVHNLVRSGWLRRTLGIPNPILFYQLAKCISENWTDLECKIRRSLLSMSIPVLSEMRAVQAEHSLSERTRHRTKLRCTSRFILQADISRFYPSVYTHSLPWAIHGKDKAKKNKDNSLYGNLLDKHIRNAQEKQTIGIPIGPDTSLVLAEVLLSAVDLELKDSGPVNGLRYIDDYEFGFWHRGDAEKALANFQRILSKYELSLNPTKTKILELPIELETHWTSALRTFMFREAGITGQMHDLIAFFNLAFNFSNKFPNDGVLKYAIPRLNSITIAGDNWQIFQEILSQCCLVEPAVIRFVIDQIVHYRDAQNYPVDNELWGATMNAIITEHLPLGHSSECAWAVWFLLVLNIDLSTESVSAINNTDDAIVALLGLHAIEQGLAPVGSLNSLAKYLKPDELYGPKWMLCYEANHKGWLSPAGGKSTIAKDPCFNFLHKHDVSFYERTTDHPPSKRYDGVVSGGGGGYSI